MYQQCISALSHFEYTCLSHVCPTRGSLFSVRFVVSFGNVNSQSLRCGTVGLKHLTARLTGENIVVNGACKKCGFAGHLAFQCRNTVTAQSLRMAKQAEDAAAAGPATKVVDVSSTSSEESEDSILGLDSDVSSEEDMAAVSKDGRDFFGRDVRDRHRKKRSERKRARSPVGSDSEDDEREERRRRKSKKIKKDKKTKKSKKAKKTKKSKSKKSKKSKH